MPAGELTGWMAYEKLEPFGEARADLRMGISTAALLNRTRSRGGKVIKASDLIPKFDDAYKPKQTPEEMKAEIMKAFK